jgi:membrane-associated phospholipid phosphatase
MDAGERHSRVPPTAATGLAASGPGPDRRPSDAPTRRRPEPRLRLPLIDRRLRAPAVIGGGLLMIVLFMVPARLHLGTPTQLQPARIDAWIPFLEWTIWIYVSYYLFLVLAIWLPQDDKRRSDAAYGLLLAAIIGVVIFTFWPTSMPRQSPATAGATGMAWQLLFAVDTMVNAFPSLHVANTCLAAVALFTRCGPWRVLVPLWSLLIIASTLTTKQHYAIDVAGGLALAVGCYLLVSFAVGYEPLDRAADAGARAGRRSPSLDHRQL